MLESLNRYFAAWLASFRSMIAVKVWMPFLILAALQGLVLILLVNAPSLGLGGAPVEFLRHWFGMNVGHYPDHLVMLPQMFFRLAIILYGLFGVLAYAIATGAFGQRFTGRWPHEESITGMAIKRLGPLLLIWVVVTAVVLLGIAQIPKLTGDWTFGSPRRVIFVDVAARIAVIAFMSFWAYTTVALIYDRASLLSAVRISAKRFFRRPMATFFLLGIPYALTIPFSLLASQSAYIVRTFRPETIAYAFVLVILSQFAANIFTSGIVTHYYLSEQTGE